MNKSKFFGSRPVFFFIEDGAGAGGGSTTITDTGGDPGGGADDALDLGVTEDTTDGEGASDGTDEGTEDKASEVHDDVDTQRNDDKDRNAPKEEPELKDFGGIASARIRGLVKQVPELGVILTKNPALRETIEGVFRRETAMREAFPTVAEARAMRTQFPSGMADVQVLLDDVKEIEEIDSNFDQRGQDGSYPGHAKLIDNFFQRDKEAAVSLFKGLPKEWARLDRGSYNEVMGKVIAATFASREIPERVQAMIDAVDEAEQPQLKKELKSLLGWMQSYTSEKPRPTQDEERLASERREFERTRNEATKTEMTKFRGTFSTTNIKLQRDIIGSHKSVQRLMKVNSISEDKKKEIVEKIRTEGEKFLAKSASFMRKLRPAYQARNIEETTNLQKAAWSQPWLLNMIVRSVFNKEIPNLVQNNRAAVERRTGAQQRQQQPANKSGDKQLTPKGPRQIGGRWYRENGTAFTTQEVLAGKHLQS